MPRVPFRFESSEDCDDDLYTLDAFDEPRVARKAARTVRRPDPVEPPAGIDDPGEPADLDGPPAGDRWSTWDGATHGPKPRPDWVVTALGAVDYELGVLKTGKEADVFLIDRQVPDGGPRCLLAAKRYRTSEHRSFHRDAGYLEGRRVRRSREKTAPWRGGPTSAGSCWPGSGRLPSSRCSVYSERPAWRCLIPFLSTAPSCCRSSLGTLQVRPRHGSRSAVRGAPNWGRCGTSCWTRCPRWPGTASRTATCPRTTSWSTVAGWWLVMIDLPQAVDIVGNPQGVGFLRRDVVNVCDWFAARGLTAADPEAIFEMLLSEAHLG